MSEARLAHGTDQGKWLMQEVDVKQLEKRTTHDARVHFQMVSYDINSVPAPNVAPPPYHYEDGTTKKENKGIFGFLRYLMK